MQIFWTNQQYRENLIITAALEPTGETLSTSTLLAFEIIMALLAIGSVTLLWITAMTEPGIIPREKNPFPDMLENVPYAYKQLMLK